MDKVSVCGKTWPVVVSWGAIKRFADSKGITTLTGLDSISNMQVDEIAPFMLDCLKAGAKASGQACDLKVEDIELASIGEVLAFFSIMGRQMKPQVEVANEASKKKKMKIFR